MVRRKIFDFFQVPESQSKETLSFDDEFNEPLEGAMDVNNEDQTARFCMCSMWDKDFLWSGSRFGVYINDLYKCRWAFGSNPKGYCLGGKLQRNRFCGNLDQEFWEGSSPAFLYRSFSLSPGFAKEWYSPSSFRGCPSAEVSTRAEAKAQKLLEFFFL